jgi:hypothetical protein
MKGHSQDVEMLETDEFYTTWTEVATQLSTAGNDHLFARTTYSDR